MRFFQSRAMQFAAGVVGIGVAMFACKSALAANSGDMRVKARWAKDNLKDPGHLPPFSFRYDGQSSGELLASWPKQSQVKKIDKARTRRETTWTDPKTGLQVRVIAVEYTDFPVVEWTVYLKNAGKENTPILENVQGLDTQFKRSADGEFVLHGNKGDWCVAESYEPYALTLGPDTVKRFAPPDNSGKSCDGPDAWPYYNLQMPGSGVIIAVGWPGQWAASFARDNGDGLRIQAGQQLTHLYLKPGEEIRTPLTAMLFWQGTDVTRAQNLWRRWYMAHVIPKVNGKPLPPLAQIQFYAWEESTRADIQTYLQAGIKPDICWRDAGAGGITWYPSSGGPFKGKDAEWLNTGTWEVDPTKYPHGFKPASDVVHELGMKFVLWFEPERVGDPDSWLGKNHQDWLLPGTSSTCGAILNEGNPDALKWLTDHVDGLIKSQGIDWYREDMNGNGPLTAWRSNDPQDRQGITENLYIQGHLAFWDALKQRNPGLLIDSCASGGRRNDLETMKRAVPLLRSDFQWAYMKDVPEGNQGHTYGISSWLPWYGSGLCYTDTYTVRSFLMPGFGITITDWEKSDSTRALVKKGYDEAHTVAPLMLGDYYPLTPYSLAHDKWIAWQFNRPEQGDGFVQAFRRDQTPDETLVLKLQGLKADAKYELIDMDRATTEYSTGAELMQKGLTVTAKSRPSAIVLTYKRR